MKKPTKRDGWRSTATATESASPGRLAISAARDTPFLSSSATQRSASASVDTGSSNPIPATASFVAPSAAKKPGEKKWMCASQMS